MPTMPTAQREPEIPGWTRLAGPRSRLGEVPIWNVTERALYWIDVLGGILHRVDHRGATTTWDLGQQVGSYCLTGSGQAIVACLDGIYELDFGSGSQALLHPAPYDPAEHQFNDGRCDPAGRFWVGTLNQPGTTEGSGAFWRLSRAGLVRVVEGVTVANGIAFSPDHGTMYLANRPGHEILAFDYDLGTGTPRRRRRFAALPEDAIPDGAATDVDGGYWVAMFRSGTIHRYRPDGTLDRVLAAPTSRPTMVCFGGAELETMFVTTASHRFSDADPIEEADAGHVFACQPGARGMPEPFFDAHVA